MDLINSIVANQYKIMCVITISNKPESFKKLYTSEQKLTLISVDCILEIAKHVCVCVFSFTFAGVYGR